MITLNLLEDEAAKPAIFLKIIFYIFECRYVDDMMDKNTFLFRA